MEEPSVPTTDLRLEFVTVKIGDKTYDVRLNHTNHTGSVELSYADFDKFDDPNANGVVAYEPNDNKATVDVSDNFTSTGDGTKAFTVTLKKTVTNNGITSDTTVVYTITATQAAGLTGSTLTYLAIKGVEVDLTDTASDSGDGSAADKRIHYIVDNITAEANSSNEPEIVALGSEGAQVVINTTDDTVWNNENGPVATHRWHITVTSQDGQNSTYYDVQVSEPESAWTGVIGSVWYYDATLGTGNDAYFEATGVSLEVNELFDTNADLSFTATAPAGYYITGFRYRVGDSPAEFTTVTDSDGNFTIGKDALSGVSNLNKLNIHVLVTPNPVVTFEDGMAKEVDSGAGWTQSISVEHGDTLYFNLQKAGTVTIDSQYADNYGELHGSDDYWYITNVTGDITATVSY